MWRGSTPHRGPTRPERETRVHTPSPKWARSRAERVTSEGSRWQIAHRSQPSGLSASSSSASPLCPSREQYAIVLALCISVQASQWCVRRSWHRSDPLPSLRRRVAAGSFHSPALVQAQMRIYKVYSIIDMRRRVSGFVAATGSHRTTDESSDKFVSQRPPKVRYAPFNSHRCACA